jgi:transaldolase
MGEGSVGSRKRSAGEGIVLGTAAEGLFSFTWPGPGNSEGPVDPDWWSVHPRGESLRQWLGHQPSRVTVARTTGSPLLRLREAGQSVWLDFLRRSLIGASGLEQFMREDGVSGVTSNPSIFRKAIVGSTDYDEAIRAFAGKECRSPMEIFYDLALADVTMAADAFRAVFEDTGGADGFVSFELEPRLAHDASGSIEAARALFQRIGRPNVMIKVPGTEEGVPVVEELTALGLNVNITLLFSVELYERVALAYIRGLERRLEGGRSVDGIASVASFFVSRVDAAVDGLLPEGSSLRGKVAIANAKRAYHRFRQLFSGGHWERLARAGARVQRPLWASTGTKDPAYSDVRYVERLVGPDTVTTVPEATLDAFRDHGRVQPGAVTAGLEEAETILGLLPGHGIDLGVIADRLVEEGLEAFETDLDELLEVIAGKLGGVHPAVVGEGNTHRSGHVDGAAVEPLAAGELTGSC